MNESNGLKTWFFSLKLSIFIISFNKNCEKKNYNHTNQEKKKFVLYSRLYKKILLRWVLLDK